MPAPVKEAAPAAPEPAVAPAELPTLQLALFLENDTPDLLLGLLDLRRRELPLDTLSNRLLNPPAPQFRLAFRTTLPANTEHWRAHALSP